MLMRDFEEIHKNFYHRKNHIYAHITHSRDKACRY